MERYYGGQRIAIQGFTTYVDPRGTGRMLTEKDIKRIERDEGLVYISHNDHDKEIAKNKRNIKKEDEARVEKAAEKMAGDLYHKWNA